MQTTLDISAIESRSRWRPVSLDGHAATLKATYLYLTISLAAFMTGGYIGSESAPLAHFFSGLVGWLVGLAIINLIPAAALAAVSKPRWGLAVLAIDGFVSGIVVSPLMYFARQVAPELIYESAVVTVAVFLAVTAYVMTTRKTYSAPVALTVGLFVSLTAATLIDMQLQMGFVGILISSAVALFGALLLVINTSRILQNPVATGAIPGALMLFAGIFNVFVGTLNVLLRLLARRR